MELCTDNSKGSPKLFDMPNKLPFTIHNSREGQCTIHCYYDLVYGGKAGDIILSTQDIKM